MVTQYILLSVGLLCLLAAVVMTLRPCRLAAAVPAYAGLLALHLSYYIAVPPRPLLFWGTAAAMVMIVVWYSPAGEPDGRRASNLYIGLSAIAGALLGMVVNARVLTLGIAIGALLGQLAYSRTPDGRWMARPATVFVRYFAAKCLPVIVAIAIVAIAIEGLIIQ